MKINKILLILILVLASVLRLWQLNNIPPHLTSDEVALGYNAYSILKTGKDEYGVTLPIVFKSFGDYKPGLYIYATVPSVAIFGLNEFAVRFPSALAGIIAVYLLYLIAKFLFKNEKIALISAFLLAILPWHIHFSRGAWEVNLSLTLTLAGIYFFFASLKRQKLLFLSVLFFALTLICYQGAKLSTSIVVILLVLIYSKELVKYKIKILIISAIIGAAIALPIFLSFGAGQTGRLNVFNIFSYPRPSNVLGAFLSEDNEQVGDINYYLFHTEGLNFVRGIMGRYFNHFSPKFLFFEGDWSNPRHSAPNMGVLIFADVILLVFGAIAFVKAKFDKEHLFILLWLILAPLPAVLTRDQVHAVRAYNMLIPLVLIASVGLVYLFSLIQNIKQKFFKLFLYVVLVSSYAISYLYYLDAYFVHLSNHSSQYWEYGFKQIVEAVTPLQQNHHIIRVQQSYSQPYIFFLFYQKYDPLRYQQNAKLVAGEMSGDVGKIEHLDNICFCPIDWSVNRGDVGSIIIGDPVRIPPQEITPAENFNVLKEIKYLDDIYTAFTIIEVKR